MTKTTQTVRRTADISRADALKGLVAKYPDFDIVSMRLETVESKTASGEVTSTQKQWVAEVVQAGFEEAGGIPPEESESPADGVDTDDPTPEAPAEEKEDGDVEIKVEGDEGGEASEKDLLQELVDLVREMVGDPAGEGAPHGDLGPEGPPSAIPGDPGLSDLPAAVKPQNSMENMQAAPRPAFAHLANRRHFFVEAEAPGQSLKSAVAELNAALPVTHRVKRIKRDGTKIIAGVARIQGA